MLLPRPKRIVPINDVPATLRKLRDFLGPTAVEKALKGQREALKIARSRPLTLQFTKARHPWIDALREFEDMERTGATLSGAFSEQILRVATDARKLLDLLPGMPKNLSRQFRQNLLKDTGGDYIFELAVAWHFQTLGYEPAWYEESAEPHPEFRIAPPGFELDIECKKVGVDSYKKFRRQDFYTLVDDLVPKLRKRSLCGQINLHLFDSLPRHEPKIREITAQIMQKIKAGPREAVHVMDFGRITIKMAQATHLPVDPVAMHRRLMQTKPPEAHAVVISNNLFGYPTDPIEVICQSDKADHVLDGVHDRIAEACTRQLKVGRPGIVFCHIPDVDDLQNLASNSGLLQISNDLFQDSKRSHVAAIVFSSDGVLAQGFLGRGFTEETLTFKNLKCKFPEVAQFAYFNRK
jgi:hypothetical protein